MVARRIALSYTSAHEGYRESLSGTATSVMPTNFEKAGDFSNTPKFLSGPAASFGAGTFGTITQQPGFSRLAQLMVRFEF